MLSGTTDAVFAGLPGWTHMPTSAAIILIDVEISLAPIGDIAVAITKAQIA